MSRRITCWCWAYEEVADDWCHCGHMWSDHAALTFECQAPVWWPWYPGQPNEEETDDEPVR